MFHPRRMIECLLKLVSVLVFLGSFGYVMYRIIL